MLNCQKDQFSIPDNIHYLNGAYFSPLMKKLELIGHQAVSRKARPFDIGIDHFYEPIKQLKNSFAQLINSDASRIAIIPSVSYGIATVTKNIEFGDQKKIVMCEEQFPSNYYSWKKLADEKGLTIEMVKASSNFEQRSIDWNKNILDAIDKETKVVTLGNVHWADGTYFDLKAIRQKATEVNALLIIDGTQSIGALPFDMQEIQADAVICAAYKWLLGPYGSALAYYGTYFDNGEPIEENWINRLESENFKNLVNYQAAYQAGAERFGVGQKSNFINTPIVHAAIEQLLEWGVDNVQQYCKQLSQNTVYQLKEMGCLIDNEAQRSGHLFGIRTNNRFDMDKLLTAFQKHHVYVSRRGNAIRVAPNVYNDERNFEVLLECFKLAHKRIGTRICTDNLNTDTFPV